MEDIGKSFKGELALAAPLKKNNVHIFQNNSDMTEPGRVDRCRSWGKSHHSLIAESSTEEKAS